MISQRKLYPTPLHWNEIQDIGSQLITLDEFLNHYDLEMKELAAVTGASYDSVRQWFSRSGRKPTGAHLLRLNIVFWKWKALDREMHRQRWG